jgi:hypothetical protein
MQDKPGEHETTAVETETSPAQPAADAPQAHIEAPASAPETATASTEAVVAAQVQQRGLPVRPIVMTVFLALLAYSGYRYWQDNRDTFMPGSPVAESYTESEQGAGWDDIPQQEAIAVVGEKPKTPSAPVATEPGVENAVATQGDTTAGDDLATGTQTQPAGTTATPWEPDVSTAPPATDPAPVPAAQAEMETPEPADITATEPAQPEPAAVVAPPAQPAQPQPPYGAPGYGYYPQQPNWQQPYYRPGYPPQYPAR